MTRITDFLERDLYPSPVWVLRVPMTLDRQEVQWREMSNENLKFTLELLYLHRSPYVGDAMTEVIRRIDRGQWLPVTPPPLLESVSKQVILFLNSTLWAIRVWVGER